MNITSCPQCGGRVRSISIGWKCESCQGFIDMRGEFHQHKEERFMPPMTNAERIRAMSDEELAVFLCAVKFRRETILNVPDFLYIKDAHDWLQQPAEEDT